MQDLSEYVGKMVSIQLARPVYIFVYAAHVDYEGKEHMIPQPLERSSPDGKKQVVTSDMLPGAYVRSVGGGFMRVELFDETETGLGNLMAKTIPLGIIVSIDEVLAFEVESPKTTTRIRQQPEQNKVILG